MITSCQQLLQYFNTGLLWTASKAIQGRTRRQSESNSPVNNVYINEHLYIFVTLFDKAGEWGGELTSLPPHVTSLLEGAVHL